MNRLTWFNAFNSVRRIGRINSNFTDFSAKSTQTIYVFIIGTSFNTTNNFQFWAGKEFQISEAKFDHFGFEEFISFIVKDQIILSFFKINSPARLFIVILRKVKVKFN